MRWNIHCRQTYFVVIFSFLLLVVCLDVVDISAQVTDSTVCNTARAPLANTYQPTPPYYSTFYYPWTANPGTDGKWQYWDDHDHNPPANWFSHYLPDMQPGVFNPAGELYSSRDTQTLYWQFAKMREARIEVAISTWWGRNHKTDATFCYIIKDVMNRPDNPYPNLRWGLYYELESVGNPSVEQIVGDLNYLAANYANQPGMLKINGKPVLFVYSGSEDTATSGYHMRWAQANQLAAQPFYIVLKLFSGYRDVVPQPDSWHQYGPATRISEHEPFSYGVSPGFWHDAGEAPRLPRNLAEFDAGVANMVNANAQWKLILTWNEWGEGTSVEPGTQVRFNPTLGRDEPDPNGAPFGNAYIDVLSRRLPPLGGGVLLHAPQAVDTSGYGNPTYTWSDLPEATGYHLMVTRRTDKSDIVFYLQNLAKGSYCNGATCSIDATTIDESYRLRNGSYVVFVRPLKNGAPMDYWNGPYFFALNAAKPETATLGNASGIETATPTLHWSLDRPGANAASWFHVWIATVDNYDKPVAGVLDKWFSRVATCGGANGTNCAWTVTQQLPAGKRYIVYMQSWGPGGTSPTWAGPAFFNVGGTPPQAPENIRVAQNQGRPTISWNDDPNATWIHVNIAGSNGVVHNKWYQRNAAPMTCASGTCSITPNINPANGNYSLKMRTWGPAGFSVRAQTGGFTDPVPIALNFAPPPTVTQFQQASVSGGTPSLRWTGVAGATWYGVWIGTHNPNASPAWVQHHKQWALGANLGCENTGTCTFTPSGLGLPAGNYVYLVRAWGPGGMNSWSAPASFSVP